MTRAAAALLLVGGALAFVAGCGKGASPAPAFAPCTGCNVVLLSVDTLRADHVGALGYAAATTPNIDAFARRAVVFENAISQSSWTRPAHMSIFTGLHPREHGFLALADTRRLEDSVPTLAGVLHDHGFRTAAFTGGVNLAAHYGFDRGFDVYRTNGKYFRDNLEDTRWWLDHEGAAAVAARQPFFLFLHGYDVHTPYFTDAVDRQAMALAASPPAVSLGETCRAGGDDARIDPFVREYDGAVHRADRYVGKILRELETRGLLATTIVVLLSDHGEEFLEHDRCFHVATVYREVLHVPLLIAAPGLAPRRVAVPVSASVTIAPTILELLGIGGHPFPEPSLLGAALGGPAPPGPIVSETERNAPNKGDGHVRALTTSDSKLVDWTSKGTTSLFDTATDPGEQRALDDPERLARLKASLDEWAAAHEPRYAPRRSERSAAGRQAGKSVPQGGKPGDSDSPNQREEERERRAREQELRSLGYAD